MYKSASVAVVVPCYNEETQIHKVVESMPSYVDKIIIVDDKSTDRTVVKVRQLETSEPRIHLICHDVNQGVGGAIASGYKYARDQGFGVAVVMAGDAQMDPNDLPALLEPVVTDLVDYSKGNRLVTGEAFRLIPKVRFLGNAVLSVLTKIASGYWRVADSQTGYTAINALALKAIDWDRMFKRYGQPNDLLVRLNVAGMRVIDVPVTPVYNVGEQSGIRVRKVVFSIGTLLLRKFFWRLKEKYVIRNFHPLLFFYGFGIFSFALSGALFVRLILRWVAQGAVPEITFLTWLFAISIAFNSVAFAMWFDYEENKHLNPPMRPRDLTPRDASSTS